MFSKFYIKFNYKNIIPFNLKKKKMRIFANLIANKAISGQGFIFGVKIKFWYYYYGINGLKKDNVLLVKNSLNKKLSVFFISNFNMIEGRWALPKIYEEYYQKYWILKKKKKNFMRINIIWNYNNINSILNLSYMSLNSYTLLFVFFWRKKRILNFINNNKYYNKFINNKFMPLIYNWKQKKKQLKLMNNLKKIKIKKKNLKKDLIYKIKYKSKVYKVTKKNRRKKKNNNELYYNIYKIQLNKEYLLNFLLFKNLINIRQFIKLYVIILKYKKNNILFLLYKFFLYFKMLKIYKKFNFYKLNEIDYIKKIKNEKISFEKIFISYIYNLGYKLKNIYVFKFFLKKNLEMNKINFYNKFSKKMLKIYKNILKKKKNNSLFSTYFFLLGKGNLFFATKNKKFIRKNHKKIKKYNFYAKSLFFKKDKTSESRVQALVLRFLRKKYKKLKKVKKKFFV